MRYEYTLARTLFVFITCLLIIGICVVAYLFPAQTVNKDQLLVAMVGSLVFMSPLVILTGVILVKMWKRKTTKLYKDV